MRDRRGDIPEIPGCRLVDIRRFEDPRGSFEELFRSEWFPGAFSSESQVNLSVSEPGVVRGLHFHRRQSDFWVLLEGCLHTALVDLRRGSPAFRRSLMLRQDSGNRKGLLIPPGVAHGYATIERSALLYVVSSLYDGSDEHGVAWDDPSLGLDWRLEGRLPVVSARDLSNPLVADLPEDSLVDFQ
ncbi:dTDP-4-dehydrorhamnose 3,5-epimerase family protein [Candidatus Fermentibacterales bacterium]|nr:dTDP-4-dehydrorhamnose 3,5-epimerase family protein [Candidatus Fermentibacterales bacterium]